MPNSHRPDPDAGGSQPPGDSESAEPAPLNRAERRAQRRGRKPSLPPAAGKGPQAGHREQIVPRRSGRRGNR
jgi:hypothetical protein